MVGIHQSELVVLATYRSSTLSRKAVGGPVQPKSGLNRRFEPPNPCFKSPTAGLNVNSLSFMMVITKLIGIRNTTGASQ